MDLGEELRDFGCSAYTLLDGVACESETKRREIQCAGRRVERIDGDVVSPTKLVNELL